MCDCSPGSCGLIQGIDGFCERLRDADVETFDDGRFGRVLRREEQSLEAQTSRTYRDRQYATDAIDGAIQREFTDDHRVVHGAAGQWSGGGEQSECDRKIERGPGL